MRRFLGIDIGGTKTGVCIGDETGRLLARLRMPSEVERGPDDWFQRLEKLLRELLTEAGVDYDEFHAVGVSAPGPLSVSQGLLLDPPNMPGWVEVPITARIQELTGRPVLLNNDANAAVLAEHLFGQWKGCRDMVYLTLSTGLGAGIISSGLVLQGACDMGGEVGYHVLDVNGPDSPCGHRGSFEAFCGGRNVALRLQRELARNPESTAVLDLAGSLEQVDFAAFLGAVKVGDPFALRHWEAWCERLAQGIGNLLMILNPEVVLLGTIGIHAGDLLLGELQNRIPAYVHPAAWEACTIAPASLGTEIGDLAALALAVRDF